MPIARDPLLEDGVAALGALLPRGYSVGYSSLGKGRTLGETWLILRGRAKKGVTCLALGRRRVEARDLGAIAGLAARTNNPALLVSTYLSPMVRERLRGYGIGYWDLAGNAHIVLAGIDLRLDLDGAVPIGDKTSRCLRSLCGEMAGRVARVLVDLPPPHALSGLAEQARVDASCVSRVVAFLAGAGIIERRPRGNIVKVHWQTILRRWSLDTPRDERGTSVPFLCGRGLPDFLDRLARSGFLHALTGDSAFAALAGRSPPAAAVLYVDEVEAAVAQFGLHPCREGADAILVKPADRSVFLRSRESNGLRYVSPSLMAADLANGETFEDALAWMAEHDSIWRQPSPIPEVGKGSRRAQHR